MSFKYDVIVVGGGHAGVEAALASARLNRNTLLFTLSLDNIGMMSCNPSIGGPGKSNLVAEIDVLGGEMGRHTDQYNLQLKHLNTSKGPAARITRGQADKFLYRTKMKTLLEETENLEIMQDSVDELIIENETIRGVRTALGIEYLSETVVLATGTFLKGRIVIGDIKYPAGRMGENSAEKLSDSLIENGIYLERYQTATPPRIDKRTVDFSVMKPLYGEEHPRYFSIYTRKEKNNVVPTWLTHTSEETLNVTKEMLKFSPIVSGIIETHGPRHCPSLDRKVLNFPDKYDHQIFLELESSESNELYVNGLTTAMPPFAQEAMLKSIKGLENAKIMRYGYAVEYDYAPASQLYPSLESKKIKGLYFAGQINGTSGYEEAATQGFIAGVNAARKTLEKQPIIFDRSEGYIGVLVDDIIHKKTPEPYRVLPSRSEYRLTLRFDNGFMRLLDKAEEIGIVSKDKIEYLKQCKADVYNEIQKIKETKVPMKDANELLEKKGAEQRLTKGVQASELLKFKEVSYDDLAHLLHIPEYPEFVKNQIETMIKYEIFIEREREQIERFKRLEALTIPEDFDFDTVTGISNIAKAGLKEIKPLSIGEASRISGVTGNDIALLLATLKN
ncbi:tRNA uridine-5-carboxymethylaminomethyl(34) synthesis enzyme MnmG [Candidatus Cetobacterium colombiensis]|jgi:tRNA uridine 5-carboxymethylaminomethyl modification enzyme|uniref:tRNA uridine 5-carboxymethylaminomethyl modification enzyme MnmG n=1 Tax=Candidatus Cetobacterium colombiensis TaxID=3073100 RepID=A0ABU4WB28_9FUSO|nr:tRNA uridine-5-carboxymethylaminomethyl(34) synthesis enzyme MnmG [Candidatus Cetobacterium colombiensis]MDX8336748.1 tRNA uridine-5-carboxymethylaminomethyl(34) synthesis enzyme MnmG [Candidatus Cetobacterium colombiensis]